MRLMAEMWMRIENESAQCQGKGNIKCPFNLFINEY